MRALQLHRPGGISNLRFVDLADPGAPASGELRVRIHATSLNGHDYNVVVGRLPVADKRILMSDASGTVEAIGEGVEGFAVGDKVISIFFPRWHAGRAPDASFIATPGDGLDGYGVDIVVRPSSWFTLAPKGWTSQEAATLPTAGVTAWRALEEGNVKAGDQ